MHVLLLAFNRKTVKALLKDSVWWVLYQRKLTLKRMIQKTLFSGMSEKLALLHKRNCTGTNWITQNCPTEQLLRFYNFVDESSLIKNIINIHLGF